MAKMYCTDCEVEVKLPGLFNLPGQTNEAEPIKYKQGWRCSECHLDHRKRLMTKKNKEVKT